MSTEGKIAIASDHAAFKLKEFLKKYLQEKGAIVVDLGCDSEESTDYPIYAHKLAQYVKAEQARGVLLCGSGIGMSIVANRYKGIRAALCTNPEFAKLSREHNNSNVLVLAARFTDENTAKGILETWLNTEFEGGRHQKRVEQID